MVTSSSLDLFLAARCLLMATISFTNLQAHVKNASQDIIVEDVMYMV